MGYFMFDESALARDGGGSAMRMLLAGPFRGQARSYNFKTTENNFRNHVR
jgi:hypothetical protein